MEEYNGCSIPQYTRYRLLTRPSKGVLPIPSESIQKSLKSSQIRIGWKSVSDEEEKQH